MSFPCNLRELSKELVLWTHLVVAIQYKQRKREIINNRNKAIFILLKPPKLLMTSYVYDCSLLMVNKENHKTGRLIGIEKLVLKISTWTSITEHAYWTFFNYIFFQEDAPRSGVRCQLIECDSMEAALVWVSEGYFSSPIPSEFLNKMGKIK